MAYTSVIPVHRLDGSVKYVLDPEKTARSVNAASLEEAVAYALNRDKTEQDLFESSIGCACATAFKDMRQVKQIWRKMGGVQGYHLVQSFAPGEVTPELAHKIGLELTERLLGGRYQVVIGTHLNTKCIHNHILWNSVAADNGKKYHSNWLTYEADIRAVSDELCRKYGLSVIETKEAKNVTIPYSEWLAVQAGKPTWKTAIQQDVDAAIASAFTWRQFLSILERQGYVIRLNRKHITLRPPGKERDVRFKTLGSQYTPEAIQQRILAPKSYPPAGRKAPRRARLRTGGKRLHSKAGLFGSSSLRSLYYVYLYKMGALPRKPAVMGYEVREDIRRLDKRIEQVQFLMRHEIDDRGQLVALRVETEGEVAALLKERQRLYRYEPNSEQIPQLTTRLKELRRTVRLCKAIASQSEEMERRMQADRQTAQRLRQEQAHTASRKNRGSARS